MLYDILSSPREEFFAVGSILLNSSAVIGLLYENSCLLSKLITLFFSNFGYSIEAATI